MRGGEKKLVPKVFCQKKIKKKIENRSLKKDFWEFLWFGGIPFFENNEFRWKIFCYQKC